MKKSLIIRWCVIAVVVLAWTASMFPIRDRDYLTEFRKQVKPQLAKLQAQAANLPMHAKAKQMRQELAAIVDHQSEDYLTRQKELDALNVSAEFKAESKLPGQDAFRALDDYQEFEKRVAALQSSDPRLSGYKVVEMAAHGDSDNYRISLGQFIRIPLQGKPGNKTALRYVRLRSAGKLNLGLDLRGGTEFIVGFDPSKLQRDQKPQEIRDRIMEILRNRLDSTGVTEPELKAITEDSISIRMPSVDEADKTDIRNTIRQSARLQFYLVATDNAAHVARYQEDPRSFQTPAHLMRREIEEERNGELNTEVVFLEKVSQPIRGEDVERAVPNVNEFGNWSISLRFNGRGSAAFAEVTGRSVGRRLAIVLDDRVYSAPNIREAITGGSAEISGSFTFEEAKRLSGVIASGNLPVSIEITSEFGTEPSLGVDSIRSGAFAGGFGLALVVVFMVWYYKFAGLVAIAALVVNTLLVFGTMAITRATITMPGLAGMVLTIGMAVDANVLIFERIREELNRGKTVANAVESGYDRVFSCILDSNLTTLITCFFLYKYGSGSVRGFAVTLGFGIIASMFTALFMTHAIFDLVVYKNALKSLKMRSLKMLNEVNVDFFKLMRPALILSTFLVVLALLTVAVRRGSVLGVDFSGGTLLTYACQGEQPDVEKIRAHLTENGYDRVRVGYKRGQGGERELEIVIPKMKGDASEFGQLLDRAFPVCKITPTSTYSVGGSVGTKFRNDAFLAAFLSFIAIVVYLSFRFEFMYGVGAVVAVIHDVIVSAGLFFLINGGELSLTVVAALMTIIGYSLNDTIVIFDRIREVREFRRDLSYRDLVNLSINQTLSRTILTTVTTLLVVVSMLIFGGGVIFDFAIVMFYGMITGTYSTIFLASAIVAHWHKKSGAEIQQNRKAAARPTKA